MAAFLQTTVLTNMAPQPHRFALNAPRNVHNLQFSQGTPMFLLLPLPFFWLQIGLVPHSPLAHFHSMRHPDEIY